MSFDPGSIVVPELLRHLGVDAEHRGDAWWLCCPFHGPEKTPSLKVNDHPGGDRNGLWHCFGCHKGGPAFELVGRVLGFVSPAVAVDWLEEHAMGAPTTAWSVAVEVAPVRRPGFQMPVGTVLAPLAAWVGPARAYALRRGVTAEQVDRWGLGYAVEGRLAGRVVFPVLDARRRPVSYAARTYVDDPKRYITARRAENPDLGSVFGQHLWPAPQSGLRSACVVAEGAINALALERAIPPARRPNVHVGALNGSDVHLRQVLALSTFSLAVVVTDPDPAGDNAAEKIVGALARGACRVERVRLPKGEDPATLPVVELRQWIERGLTRQS